jgi:hypothetical protein
MGSVMKPSELREELIDLREQATKERSHFYVRKVVEDSLMFLDMYEEFIQGICKYMVLNSERESGFLYPDPQFYLFSKPLADHIIETSGIPKDTILEWLEAYADEKDRVVS